MDCGRKTEGGGEDSGGLQRGCVALRSVALRRAALLLLLLMRRRRCVRLC